MSDTRSACLGLFLLSVRPEKLGSAQKFGAAGQRQVAVGKSEKLMARKSVRGLRRGLLIFHRQA
jgi:hypothetical protein